MKKVRREGICCSDRLVIMCYIEVSAGSEQSVTGPGGRCNRMASDGVGPYDVCGAGVVSQHLSPDGLRHGRPLCGLQWASFA
eukprot:scaffold680474_cov41-Prasinocladus_malaysianus.AAC.1